MRRGKTAGHTQSVQRDSRQEKDDSYQTHDKMQLGGIATDKRTYVAVRENKDEARPDASRKKNLNSRFATLSSRSAHQRFVI
jgi:hypothetical protein